MECCVIQNQDFYLFHKPSVISYAHTQQYHLNIILIMLLLAFTLDVEVNQKSISRQHG